MGKVTIPMAIINSKLLTDGHGAMLRRFWLPRVDRTHPKDPQFSQVTSKVNTCRVKKSCTSWELMRGNQDYCFFILGLEYLVA